MLAGKAELKVEVEPVTAELDPHRANGDGSMGSLYKFERKKLVK